MVEYKSSPAHRTPNCLSSMNGASCDAVYSVLYGEQCSAWHNVTNHKTAPSRCIPVPAVQLCIYSAAAFLVYAAPTTSSLPQSSSTHFLPQTSVGKGSDLDSTITMIFEEKELHGIAYSAELSDASLAAVRADIGVDMLELICGLPVSTVLRVKRLTWSLTGRNGWQTAMTVPKDDEIFLYASSLVAVARSTETNFINGLSTSYNDQSKAGTYKFEVSEREGNNTERYLPGNVLRAHYGLQMIASSGKLPTPVNDNGYYDLIDHAGEGFNVYVSDSGIRITHRLFQGRARNFQGRGPNDKSPYTDSIIGAINFSVAPYVNLINVKVTDGHGSVMTANLGQAITDVIKEHNANIAQNRDLKHDAFRFRGSRINLSLGLRNNPSLISDELDAAEKAGIAVFAAAGNDDADVRNTYPCATSKTHCIAAVDNTYHKASFSNYGSVIDYIAPGHDILSLGIRDDYDQTRRLGTSMATEYATGAAAIFASWQGLVNDEARHYGDHVWWNSLPGLATGFSSDTNNRFINTGIHSKKKNNEEPFRRAGKDLLDMTLFQQFSKPYSHASRLLVPFEQELGDSFSYVGPANGHFHSSVLIQNRYAHPHPPSVMDVANPTKLPCLVALIKWLAAEASNMPSFFGMHVDRSSAFSGTSSASSTIASIETVSSLPTHGLTCGLRPDSMRYTSPGPTSPLQPPTISARSTCKASLY
nr:subtilisin-like serine protease pepc [Quercus suber]